MEAAGWTEGKALPGSRDLPNSEVLQGLLTDGLFVCLLVVCCWRLLMVSGLHLSPEGYRVVFAEVLKAVKENWPEQDPERLPMVYPWWMKAPRVL